jgi:NADH:ubiquinone oxidoreductase subunit 6 (subunit J)
LPRITCRILSLLSALTLVCGFLVVANPFSRNPVTSAMFLVLTIVSMAGLFVLLHAFFLAAVQILVYAGAVMVLFLFVIMLLDLKEEEQRRVKRSQPGCGDRRWAPLTLVFVRAIRFSPAAEPPAIGGRHRRWGGLFSPIPAAV